MLSWVHRDAMKSFQKVNGKSSSAFFQHITCQRKMKLLDKCICKAGDPLEIYYSSSTR